MFTDQFLKEENIPEFVYIPLGKTIIIISTCRNHLDFIAHLAMNASKINVAIFVKSIKANLMYMFVT
jgi:hypothetical protein